MTAVFWTWFIDLNLTPIPSGVTLITSPVIQTVFSKLAGEKAIERLCPRDKGLRLKINTPPRLISRIIPLESPDLLVYCTGVWMGFLKYCLRHLLFSAPFLRSFKRVRFSSSDISVISWNNWCVMVGSCRGVFNESIVKHLMRVRIPGAFVHSFRKHSSTYSDLMRVVIATKRTINVGLK